MVGDLRGSSRVWIALLLLLVTTLLPISFDRGDRDAAAPPRSPRVVAGPELTMTLGRDRLAIAGTSHSAEHEAAIEQIVADRFPGLDVQPEFTAGILLPDNWVPVSVRLLYVMAAMESATAKIDRDQVSLRGVTAEPDVFRQRLAFLREAMGPGSTLEQDVIQVDQELALDELCRRAFARLGALPVAFAESSAALRESSYPSLDKLVDFAWDCRNTTILIVGHTDASGNESWNRQLSRARAQAVADYLTAKGVAAERLVVEGRGSAEPVADNETRYGRSRNRRIEFELR